MVTWVAFPAVAVSVDELPAVIDAGEAETATVGADVEPEKLVPPQPAISNESKAPGTARASAKVPGS
jgi:hypothetical protein